MNNPLGVSPSKGKQGTTLKNYREVIELARGRVIGSQLFGLKKLFGWIDRKLKYLAIHQLEVAKNKDWWWWWVTRSRRGVDSNYKKLITMFILSSATSSYLTVADLGEGPGGPATPPSLFWVKKMTKGRKAPGKQINPPPPTP